METNWQTIIGLEIHAELKTRSKMFCSCPNNPEAAAPNTNVCEVCLGHPGSLPTINREAVAQVIKTGLALHCQIAPWTKFDRKNYFYPDLPKGYQISQYDQPLAKNGWLMIQGRKINIERIHLEEDTGKLIHLPKEHITLVDFNRAGVPLMEMVTRPDLRTGEEVRDFAKEFQLTLRYLGVSEADMEKGQMRVEVNISVIREGEDLMSGTKVEIKNLNSFHAAKKAVEYETMRQRALLERGEKVIQETRGWDGSKTVSQRLKEGSADYHYFPEPDLPAFIVEANWVKKLREELPELPFEKRERFQKEYSLSGEDIETLIREKSLADFFEKAESELHNWANTQSVSSSSYQKMQKLMANYLLTDLKGMMTREPERPLKITPENFAEFILLVFGKKLSSPLAKKLLREMFQTGGDPSDIMEEEGFRSLDNDQEVEKLAKEIIEENEEAVKDYQAGKEKALKFLIGQLMRKTKGQVNPQLAEQILVKLLKSGS